MHWWYILKNLIEIRVSKENILEEHAMGMALSCLWNNVSYKYMQLACWLWEHFIRTKMFINKFWAPLHTEPQLLWSDKVNTDRE